MAFKNRHNLLADVHRMTLVAHWMSCARVATCRLHGGCFRRWALRPPFAGMEVTVPGPAACVHNRRTQAMAILRHRRVLN